MSDPLFQPTQVLDARNLLCPMPIFRSEASMKKLAVGEILEVWGTDPGLSNDLPAWCSVNGHKLLAIRQEGRLIIGWVEKGE
ncbi:MAG: sulfurtransferase TusA family protein [Magnetococcales bacterium]|nr:sulfurtransferase TusA family protein [Magnetococcales bacterium]